MNLKHLNTLLDTIKNNQSNPFLVTSYLNEKGNDVDDQNEDGQTLLLAAVQAGNFALIHLLISNDYGYNADPDIANEYGFTPLMLATGQKIEITRFLLDSGADVALADLTGRTALHWAVCSQNHTELLRMLLPQADKLIMDKKDACHETATDLVIKNNYENDYDLLITYYNKHYIQYTKKVLEELRKISQFNAQNIPVSQRLFGFFQNLNPLRSCSYQDTKSLITPALNLLCFNRKRPTIIQDLEAPSEEKQNLSSPRRSSV